MPNAGNQYAWVGASNLKESNNRGHFQKTTRVYIPNYAYNTNIASHFTLQLIFKDQSTVKENQTLLSNCKSRYRKVPPIAIMMNSIDGMIYFVADNDSSISNTNVHISLPYDVSIAVNIYDLLEKKIFVLNLYLFPKVSFCHCIVRNS